MPVDLRWAQCCEVHECKAPARDYGLCTSHYLGLTPFERKVVRDCAGQPTEPECVGLEVALLLEWSESFRSAA